MRLRHLPACGRPTALSLLLLCFSCVLAFAQCVGHAQDELGDLMGDGEDDKLSLEDEAEGPDLGGLQYSCFMDLRKWRHVQPERRRKKDAGAPIVYRWRAGKGGVIPVRKEPITALLNVPEAGSYRIFLRHIAAPSKARSVDLAITRRGAEGGKAGSYAFGEFRFPDGKRGRELEKEFPVILESEAERIGFFSRDVTLWEYRDVDLEKGICELALSSENPEVVAKALFITRAKAFRPSLSPSQDDRALGRLYMRVRLANPAPQVTEYVLGAGLVYHWRGRSAKGKPGPAWGWPIGSVAVDAPDAWSPFLEATDAAIPGPGPWSTCRLSFNAKVRGGIASGMARVQFAWYPHEAAVLKDIQVAIGNGKTMLRVPHGNGAVTAKPEMAVWGMWRQDYVNGFQNMKTALEPWIQCGVEEVDRLGLPADHPRCKNIRILVGNGVPPPYSEAAAEMLAKLGANRIKGKGMGLHGLWGAGAPASVVERYNLYDETTSTFTGNAAGIAATMTPEQRARHTLHKGGDEISTYVEPEAINADPGKLRAFRAYLAEQAKSRGMTIGEFLGVEDARDLKCIGALPANPGRFERRLYYHSHRYCHLASVPGYRNLVAAYQKHFPNVRVYNNYSPHPVFLTGSTMNHSDWFVLCRNQAQTMGWAEDWVRRNHSKFSFQDVSYYAALVACAARKYSYPSGFYVGLNCGGGARKMFSCLGQGITWLLLYSWGPVDSMAEASNAWSWYRSQYRAAARATHALGPADTIIGKGEREQPRTAILYNRSHEIWQGGTGRLNKDWTWSFTGLRSDQIPVDVIIEEDLVAKELERYDVLYLGGFNLDQQHLANVRAWLEKDENHLLIGSGGALMYDIHGDRLTAAERLFGARQTRAPKDHPRSLKTARFIASGLYSAREVNAYGRDDLKFILTPTSGKEIAYYDGGDCAAVVNRVGKGRALLIGFYPGYTFYYDDGRVNAPVREWHNEPVLRTLGRQRVEFDYHLSEVALFEHAAGAAVLLTDFGKSSTDVADIKDAPPPKQERRLSVHVDRPVKSVASALRGPLEWEVRDGRVEIRVPNPDPVDVIILRW